MGAFLRRDVAAIKNRSHKTAAIAEKIAQAHELFPRRPSQTILERFRREKVLRHGSSPFGDHGQDCSGAKGQTDHAIWDGGEEHPLRSSPKRIDVDGKVQAEQRFLQRRVDHRVALFASVAISMHLSSPLPRLPRCRLLCAGATKQRLRPPWQRSTIAPGKREPKLPRDCRAVRESESQNRKEQNK